MTKSSLHSDQDKAAAKEGIFSLLEESAVADWFVANGKYLIYGLCAVLVLFIIFYRVSSSHGREVEQDYIQASSDFITVIKATDSSTPAVENALKQLESLMKSHPELHAIYDGALAQTFLNRSQIDKALPLAESTLARTKVDDLPLYRDFAATTLLISTEKYPEALKNSITLQEKMGQMINTAHGNEESSFSEELFAINLFRIAMLQQQLEDKAAELKSWQEWKQYAGLSGNKTLLSVQIKPQAFRRVIQQLAIGDVSLIDYIAYRENLLQLKAK